MIDDLQAALNLAEDVDRLQPYAEEDGWSVSGPNDLVVYVTIASAIDGESYCLRFECQGYPDDPFSIKPVDPDTKDSAMTSAWPT